MPKPRPVDTRPALQCTSCRGDGFLHYSESSYGGRSRHCVDKDEPCWTCGGQGYITSDMVNMDGNSIYDIIAAKGAPIIASTRCDICQRVLPAAEVLRIGDTAVCDTCREEYTP